MNKDWLSIDGDDDNEDYVAFTEFLTEHTKRNKRKALSEIEMFGDAYLKEIEWKKKQDDEKKNKLVSYIIKHCQGKYDTKTLMEYSYEDVLEIYNEYKKKNRTLLSKIFHFVFNLS